MHMNKITVFAIVIIVLVVGIEVFYAFNKNSLNAPIATENTQAYTPISAPK